MYPAVPNNPDQTIAVKGTEVFGFIRVAMVD
jgi:hypothetical protein